MSEMGGKSQLDSVLDDLAIRFVINCPEEELESFDRLLFQVEEAHWFYEDFYREKFPNLPCFNLKQFSENFFKRCPLLEPYHRSLDKIFASFTSYKLQVPVCGAILLNHDMTKFLLVKGWNSRTWGFPRGKKNKQEPELDCAVREVMEETGYDASGKVFECNAVELKRGSRRSKLYIVQDVPENFQFGPKTRKEISEIEWHNIEEIFACVRKDKVSVSVCPSMRSSSFFLVTPYLKDLRLWISKQKRSFGRQQNRMPSPTIRTARQDVEPVGRSCSFSGFSSRTSSFNYSPVSPARSPTTFSGIPHSPVRLDSYKSPETSAASLTTVAPAKEDSKRDLASAMEAVSKSVAEVEQMQRFSDQILADSPVKSAFPCDVVESDDYSVKLRRRKTESPFLNFRFDRAALLHCLNAF
mmetsp:Transcript_15468/g.26613  ORF Transcript_15468/g.26613 Transcript_15468/m.26613 type:complete len:412 (+) Transcript_15468:61-1296(+)|eukprot:CAMPEP_0196656724 /NCGR_PEP_ID=MMETSP1086-20130531/19401_1 /TAXON_ID=77921 /ORGANISM="Cyanoptyche  gloeocystis , Strain SAG4.97" /LENGTH=411 /DNA_ID=CAMNT_0041989577 /DNA_START=56 /DNA_END=1291 /DNA_ORIENTATION=-